MHRTAILATALLVTAGCATSHPTGVVLGPAPEAGEEIGPSHGPRGLTAYLPDGALDSLKILPPPPAPESPQGKAERAFYESSRALAGTPRWAVAIQDNDLWRDGAMKRYACAMGVDISRQATPTAWTLMHRLEVDVRVISTPAKRHYNRTRPPVGDNLPICVARAEWMKTNGSYPSGHSMAGWAWGLVLAELVPHKADAALLVGREVGDSRAICGVHYLSDVEAGRILGAAMVARLQADAAFRADMAKARRELARAPAPSGCL